MLKKTHHRSTHSLLGSLLDLVFEGERVKQGIQILFFFAGIVLALANIFVASRLSPVFQAIGKLEAADLTFDSRLISREKETDKIIQQTEANTKLLERIDERTQLILKRTE